MSARAHVEFDNARFGVRLAVRVGERGSEAMILWPDALVLQQITEAGAATDESWLRLDESVARAIYEALGDYFGGNAQDVRLLRRDYEAERKRVDLFIAKAVQS